MMRTPKDMPHSTRGDRLLHPSRGDRLLHL